MEQQDSLRTYLGPGETLVQSSYEINTDCLSMSYLHDKSDVTIGVEWQNMKWRINKGWWRGGNEEVSEHSLYFHLDAQKHLVIKPRSPMFVKWDL